ncbi:protein serine/threonine phosphatase 2C family protein [Nonomuraea sp. PA05]|uniref:PP2C family protein-serine/threonine phosphatase n=1 Tax=Nonomuraea sp. PA05 TaxID=2604466 RepID=UPI0011D742FE|nr:protein phosphatase 2C domain-containing protein [Nonomuraea sp. PA05]TYB61010.1 protein serine/threonine phosphatase 2C family protein [Nonomuraea sp. PA05]
MTEPTPCVSCGGTVAPDGHCWDCGTSQPAFRSHVELTADGGAAGVSDRGLRRAVNADAMALSRVGEWTVGVVCDGVSMSARPERAAQVAAEAGAAATVASLRAGALPETALVEGAIRAGRAVSALAGPLRATETPATAPPASTPPSDPFAVSPACTYVAGITTPAGIWTCWIGDSRAYWLPHEGVPMTLTEDDTGDHEALSAWLGADATHPDPHLRSYRPHSPGLLLLCTDGLWRHLPTPGSLQSRTAGPRDHPVEAARALVSHALAEGGQDNVTALLLPAGPRSHRG